MKGVKNVDNLKEEIKEAVSKFIERRLILSRELQGLRYGIEELFSLDAYITLAIQYDNLLESLYAKRKNGEEEIVFEKEGQEISMYDAVKALKKNLRNEKIWKVEFMDSNIKDIVNLIKRYFDIIDLSKFGAVAEVTNENFFLRGVLSYIRDNDEKKYADLADRYMHFFYAQDTVGFNRIISGSISVGYSDLINISNGENQTIFRVNENKQIVTAYNEDNDYFLMGKDIIFGLSIINGEETYVPVRTVIKDGVVKYHPFLYTNQLFDESKDVCENKIFPYQTLKELLKIAGLEEYYEDVYKSHDFMELMDLVRNCLMMNEEQKEKIEEVSQIAADWWISVVSIPEHKAGLEGLDGLYVEYAAEELAKKNLEGSFTEQKVEALRDSLKSTIRKLLISRGTAMLSVDYAPDYELKKCSDKADVSGFITFPWKTSMIADLDEVKVKYGYGARQIPIFKRDTINQEAEKEVVKKEL